MAISEKKRAYNRKWHEENSDQVKAYRERTKDKRNARRRELYQQDERRRTEAVEAVRQYNKNHPLAKRASTYGMSRRDLELMLNGGCAICGAGMFDVRVKLEIDHNHRTGKVRGALCHDCNLAIGCMRDDPIIVAAALRYLLKEAEHHE